MSRKKQQKQVEEVVEIKEEEEKIETPVAAEETEAPVVEEKPSEDEVTEAPGDVKEPEKEEEKIDPRIATMIALNRKQKISEKDKQTKIYSAMASIKIVRS